jgi:hypothetical protein
VSDGLVRREINAAAEVGVRNTQPEGIGRVAALAGLVCWNNLGRNVVFADHELRPRALFGTTLFPGEDEPSQYDFDVHAILDLPELGLVTVLNHFGAVRAFRRSEVLRLPDVHAIEPWCLWWFVPDVERTVAISGCLVGSAPRSEGALGLLVSASLAGLPDGETIPVSHGATEFGEVTALAVVPSPDGQLIVAGGEGQVALFPFVGGQLGSPLWRAPVGFRVAAIAWHSDLLWAAGPEGGRLVDDYDWDQLGGGAFAALDPAAGRAVLSGLLPDDVAWGTGGVAVAPFGRLVVAAARNGGLHLLDPRRDARTRSSPGIADASLGIAHLAVAGRRVICGFNRGGYRLAAFTHSSARAVAP